MADLDFSDFSKNVKKFTVADDLRLGSQIDAAKPSADIEQQAAEHVAASVPAPTQEPQPQTQPQPAAPPPVAQPQAQPAAPVKETVTTSQQPVMQPMQTTVQRNIIDPKLVAEQKTILEDEKNAVQAKTDADVAQNTAIAAEQSHRAAFMQQEADNQAAANAQRQKVAQEKLTAIDKAISNYDAGSTINPKRLEQRMGVGGNILATIAKAFGAFGSALTNSPNYAAEEIQHAIDRDIDAQKHDVQILGQKVNFANNQYQLFRNQGLDEDAAHAATRMLKLQQSNAKIDELLANTKNPQLQATAQQIKAQLDDAANKTRMQYGQTQMNTVSQAPAAAGPKSIEDQLRLRGLEVNVPQTDPTTGKPMPAKTYMAKTKEDAEEVRKALVVRNAIRSNMAQMKKFMESTTNHSVGANGAQISAMADDMRTQFAVLRHLGALSDKDYKVASQLGDPTSWMQRDSTTYKLMEQLDKRLDSSVESELRGRGLIQ